MKHQVINNLDIIRIMLDESRLTINKIAENSVEVQTQFMLLEDALIELTWAIMNARERNY